jgi:hypothetical protein
MTEHINKVVPLCNIRCALREGAEPSGPCATELVTFRLLRDSLDLLYF